MDASRKIALELGVVTTAVRAMGPLRAPASRVAGAIWFASHPAADRVRAAANHRRLQPHLTRAQAMKLARRSHEEYARMMADSIWADPMSPAQIRRVVEIRGEQHLLAGRGGGVLVVAHFGNWDMAASAALALGLRLATVMAPVGSATVTGMVAMSRERKGFELFTPQQAARGLVRAIRGHRMAALMVDVPEAGPTVVVPFCGGAVRFSAVPARLAAATRVPIIPVACWREDGGWVLDIHAPVEASGDETAVMSRVAAVIEPAVRAHPEQWYPFHEVYVGGRSAAG